jgi:hypothetical protein
VVYSFRAFLLFLIYPHVCCMTRLISINYLKLRYNLKIMSLVYLKILMPNDVLKIYGELIFTMSIGIVHGTLRHAFLRTAVSCSAMRYGHRD